MTMSPSPTTRAAAVVALAAVVVCGQIPTRLVAQGAVAETLAGERMPDPGDPPARARLQRDLVALNAYRPEFPFWRYIFTVPDGAVIFGSAVDGRLLATFPVAGDWLR